MIFQSIMTSIDIDDILDIHKYLMKNHDLDLINGFLLDF